jgi:hypothetical protein
LTWLQASKCGRREVPLEIPNQEILIRSVTTWHLKGASLSRDLFLEDQDEVSVSRESWIPPWMAKRIAICLIQNRRLPKPKLYKGLAFIAAERVRLLQAHVIDSRSEYLGHAHVAIGMRRKQENGEALGVQQAKARNARAQKLADAASYVEDPNIDGWRFDWDRRLK